MSAEAIFWIIRLLFVAMIVVAIIGIVLLVLGFCKKREIQEYTEYTDIVDDKEIVYMTYDMDRYIAAGFTMLIISGCLFIVLAFLCLFLFIVLGKEFWNAMLPGVKALK